MGIFTPYFNFVNLIISCTDDGELWRCKKETKCMVKMPRDYLTGRICCECKCGNEGTYRNNSGSYFWYSCKCGNESCTGWLCHKDYTRRQSHKQGGYVDTMKFLTDVRMSNVKIDDDKGRYIMCQVVVAKTLKIDDLNIKNDNDGWPVDMEHKDYGKIDVKCSSLWYRRGIAMWTYSTFKKIDCNTYILLGLSQDHENIEDVRIIPNDGWISGLTTITISRSSIKTSKYDQFLSDPKVYNDNYQDLRSFFKDKKVFGIDDIDEWLKK